jgi:lactate permease
MAAMLRLGAFFEVFQITGVAAGLTGCVVIYLLSRRYSDGEKGKAILPPDNSPAKSRLNFHLAFLPYYLLIFSTLIIQIPSIKEATGHLYLGVNYPGTETALGYVVNPVENYAMISLVGHPAPVILFSFFMTIFVFCRSQHWREGVVIKAISTTGKQCIQPSLSVIAIVIMALIMNDSGMTQILANGIAQVTGVAFPVFSPYIGVLGCFMTGSNTNSNVMFGALQTSAANSLSINTAVIASAQSIGGSLGAAIAPAKVLLGSSTVWMSGREGYIMRKTLIYCVIVTFLVGLQALISVRI